MKIVKPFREPHWIAIKTLLTPLWYKVERQPEVRYCFSLFCFCTTFQIVFLQMLLLLGVSKSDKFDEDQYGVKYANECEVCKIVTWEFWNLLQKSKGKTEVLETGYSIEKNKKKTKYAKSELRLIETRSVCHFDIIITMRWFFSEGAILFIHNVLE